jgi:cardiolipin synthase
MLHAKMILCDDWVSVGSANLDRWSFRWNLEANQEIDSAQLATAAAALFEGDLAQSRLISRRHWGERGRGERIREDIAGRLDRLLDSWRRP